jgi:hypothetical protein
MRISHPGFPFPTSTCPKALLLLNTKTPSTPPSYFSLNSFLNPPSFSVCSIVSLHLLIASPLSTPSCRKFPYSNLSNFFSPFTGREDPHYFGMMVSQYGRRGQMAKLLCNQIFTFAVPCDSVLRYMVENSANKRIVEIGAGVRMRVVRKVGVEVGGAGERGWSEWN